LEHMFSAYPQAVGKYGLTDGIGIFDGTVWICPDYIGIDKGVTVLMLDNYLHGTIWKLYMNHPLIRKAVSKLGFTEKAR